MDDMVKEVFRVVEVLQQALGPGFDMVATQGYETFNVITVDFNNKTINVYLPKNTIVPVSVTDGDISLENN